MIIMLCVAVFALFRHFKKLDETLKEQLVAFSALVLILPSIALRLLNAISITYCMYGRII